MQGESANNIPRDTQTHTDTLLRHITHRHRHTHYSLTQDTHITHTDRHTHYSQTQAHTHYSQTQDTHYSQKSVSKRRHWRWRGQRRCGRQAAWGAPYCYCLTTPSSSSPHSLLESATIFFYIYKSYLHKYSIYKVFKKFSNSRHIV